jgi:hypothetical protein
MEITIDNYEDLLTFIKRKDVTAAAAVDVFEAAFKIIAVVFVDAQTREPNFEKEKVIQKIEDFINNCRNGQFDKVVLFS